MESHLIENSLQNNYTYALKLINKVNYLVLSNKYQGLSIDILRPLVDCLEKPHNCNLRQNETMYRNIVNLEDKISRLEKHFND